MGHSVGWGGWGGDTDTYTHMIASIRLGGTLGWGGVGWGIRLGGGVGWGIRLGGGGLGVGWDIRFLGFRV